MIKIFKNKKFLLWTGISLASVGVIATSIVVYKNRKKIKPALDSFINYFGEKTMLSNSYPAGVRNNNPGNLRITDINWQGKVPVSKNTDKRFEQFYTYEYGVRAMLKDIINDYNKGKKSVRKLISEYSPPSENSTEAYINWVSQNLGVKPDDTLNMTKDTLKTFAIAIIKMENGTVNSGKVYLRNSQFETAYNLL